MPKPTNQQKIIAALEARGCVRIEKQTTSRRVAFTHYDKLRDAEHIYVGTSGGLRIGVNYTASLSQTERPLHRELIAEGQRILAERSTKR